MARDKGSLFYVLAFLVVFFLTTILGCGLDPSQLLPEPTLIRPSSSIEPRSISRDFSENILWRRNDISIRHIPVLPPVILAGHGYLAYVNYLGGPLSTINRLDVLDATTGTALWQSEPFADHEAIAMSKDRAFVLLDLGRILNIYDIGGSSKPLYTYNYFKEFTQFYLFPTIVKDEENIHIYYVNGNKYFLHDIDLEGRKSADFREIKVYGRHPRLVLFDDGLMLTTDEDEYIAARFETGEEMWRIPASNQFSSWPVLQDEILIIPAGSSLKSKLLAVDARTGNTIWDTEKEFVSNAVFHKDGLYALRNDAVLVEFDFETGQIEQEISFEPTSTSAGEHTYWLASDDERLFVYFGDSQELFALDLP